MAVHRVALETKQSARHFRCQHSHRRGLSLRLGQLELAGIDQLQRRDVALLGRVAAGLGRAERLEMDVSDSDLGKSCGSDVLEKPGRRDSGKARTSMTRRTPTAVNTARKSGIVAPS